MDKDKKCEIHITNNFNAPIGQHIDHVDTINFRMDGDGTFHFGHVESAGGSGCTDSDKDAGQQAEEQDGGTVLPAVLAGSELWERVKDAGLVDEHGQPTVSRPQAALLADMLAQRLDIANKWKVFERMWNRKNMRNDYNTAMNQKKSLDFQERLKKI